ncbi:MAG: carboxy terminal-processing peptidase [Desulfobacteraceae bacterium]|jgi:carboxyl-terminal processing protease
MINKIRYFNSFKTLLLLLLVLSGLLLAGSFLKTDAETGDNTKTVPNLISPTKEEAKTARALVKKLGKYHYLDEPLDDTFSGKIFDNYIKLLDPARVHFLVTDINEFSKYRNSFDEDLKNGNLKSAFFIYSRYHQRRKQRLDYTFGLLNKGIDSLDFNKNEYLELDRENLPWHTDMNAAEDLWRRLLKNDILNLKFGDTSIEEIPSTLTKRYENQLRILEQTNSNDVFKYFITAYTHSYDPHTEYFPPAESENFDIHMRLSLEGIGALLRSEDGYVKVEELVAGGPAERGKELQPADRIVAVGQDENGELVDVEGWRLDDVVELIRGPKGTVVRLRVIPADNTEISKTRVISITRDTVKLEEQSAKKSIIEVKRGETLYKVGIITLPAFYVDFEAAMSGDTDFRSSTRDVERLIWQLQGENIDGLIIDLRNNGGGSLQEADDMTGLFISTGPVVQIRDADDRITIGRDHDSKLAYSGPMAVLVNRLSASASEIFAGAIQDYGRGIVIGSQTFGKGTVQSMESLKPGRVKYTQAKYYRINGDSTQNRGVIPDIVFPTIIDQDEIGESSLPQTMAWDHIQPVNYHRLAMLTATINYLDKLHKQRIAENADFKYLNERVAFMEENKKKTTTSLNESERRQERKTIEQRLLAMENRRRQALGKEPYKDYAALETAEKEEDNDLKKDFKLQETGEILTDWVDQERGSTGAGIKLNMNINYSDISKTYDNYRSYEDSQVQSLIRFGDLIWHCLI